MYLGAAPTYDPVFTAPSLDSFIKKPVSPVNAQGVPWSFAKPVVNTPDPGRNARLPQLPEFMQEKVPKADIRPTSIFEPRSSPSVMPVSRSSTNAYSVVGQDMRSTPEPAISPDIYSAPTPWYKQRAVILGGGGALLVLLAFLATRSKHD